MRLGMFQVSEPLMSNTVAASIFFYFLGADRINLRRVEPKNLGAELWRDFGIPIFRAQFGRDLECAECLDLILWRAIPDGVRAPEDVVLAAILQEFAQRMRRRFRVAHQEAPGAAKFGINITVGRYAVLDERTDQGIDAIICAPALEGAFRNGGDETRVIDQESNVGEAFGDDTDIAALAMFVGLFTEGQPLMDADDFYAEFACLFDESRCRCHPIGNSPCRRDRTGYRFSMRIRPSAPSVHPLLRGRQAGWG